MPNRRRMRWISATRWGLSSVRIRSSYVSFATRGGSSCRSASTLPVGEDEGPFARRSFGRYAVGARPGDADAGDVGRTVVAPIGSPSVPWEVAVDAQPFPEPVTATTSRFINRELSWLEFDSRVLAFAEDPARLLLERVKFVAIYTQNLDEFFQIRVSGLEEQVDAGVAATTPDGMGPQEQLAAIRELV